MNKSKTTIAQILSFEPNETELRAKLSSKTMDWDWFVKASSQLGVMTSAYCRLEQKGLLDLLPEDLNSYLSDITQINRNRNETLLHQVKELSVLFDTHNIPHVFLKGSALMASGYFKDFGERLIGDIDVLVGTTDLYKAEQILLDIEYVSLKNTVFGKYKTHRHLPRLVHKDRLGAVEIHSKLLQKEVSKLVDPKEILANRITINQVYVPDAKTNLDVLVLNNQVNDFGYLLKFTNFKCCYDSLVLEQQHKNLTNHNYKTSKYHRVFFYLKALYFKNSNEDSSKLKTIIVKNFYKHVNQNGVVKRIHTVIVKIYIGLITCMSGVRLFVKNKHFRADVWNHKSEVIKLFKGNPKS